MYYTGIVRMINLYIPHFLAWSLIINTILPTYIIVFVINSILFNWSGLRKKLKWLKRFIFHHEVIPACITSKTHNCIGVVYLCVFASVRTFKFYCIPYLNITAVPRLSNCILLCFLFSVTSMRSFIGAESHDQRLHLRRTLVAESRRRHGSQTANHVPE